MNSTNEPSTPVKSTFVTVMAWIFIVLASFTTLISILQNIMLQVMFAGPDMANAMASANQAQDMPLFARVMANNFRLIFAAFMVLSATTLISAIGLLKRKNWARLLFIVIMGLGIAWNLVVFAMQLFMFPSMPQIPPDAPADIQSEFQTISIVMTVVGAIIATSVSLLFGWIIKRLLSPAIASEFSAGP